MERPAFREQPNINSNELEAGVIEQRIAEIAEKDHAQAQELSAEYDRLKESVAMAVRDLRAFYIEKLGISPDR